MNKNKITLILILLLFFTVIFYFFLKEKKVKPYYTFHSGIIKEIHDHYFIFEEESEKENDSYVNYKIFINSNLKIKKEQPELKSKQDLLLERKAYLNIKKNRKSDIFYPNFRIVKDIEYEELNKNDLIYMLVENTKNKKALKILVKFKAVANDVNIEYDQKINISGRIQDLKKDNFVLVNEVKIGKNDVVYQKNIIFNDATEILKKTKKSVEKFNIEQKFFLDSIKLKQSQDESIYNIEAPSWFEYLQVNKDALVSDLNVEVNCLKNNNNCQATKIIILDENN